jgi:plastocyanin
MNRSSFALRRGAILSITLGLSAVLAACGGSTSSSAGASDGSSSDGGTVAVADGNVDLSAENLEFSASVIEAPAGEEFTITFTNLEAVPHNVVVLTEEGGDEIVAGDVLSEADATETITVPALEPGEYYFFCEIHPDMNGTIVVEG